MKLSNAEIAQIFENIADILEIQDENRFKVLSYRRAGETLGDLPRDLNAYVQDKTLHEIPGVGDAIAEKIIELLETGKLQFYERLLANFPIGVLEMRRINGVGPKKARLFWQELNITSVTELEAAARAGKLRDLAGMGAKSEQKILEAIEALSRQSGRTPLWKAQPAAEHVLAGLLGLPQALEGCIAGSIRRGRTTIGDVDLLIASNDPAPIMAQFVSMPQVARVLGHGETKSSVELKNGLQMDLRILPPERWGTALQYFTGSKDHNVKVRTIALDKGYSLNEHALSPVDEHGKIIEDAEKIYCAREEEVYQRIGLPWIPPEMREDNGEVEAALADKLPQLVTLLDLRADLHMHTTASDGTLSIREMAESARARGHQYIVISDHSQRSVQANGLSAERLLAQQQEIRQLNEEYAGDFHILHGVEMDIREDGALDYPDEVLAQLDFVIASLHFGLSQPREQVTQRLLNAVRSPHVDMIGHMTGRLIGSREGAQLDVDAIFDAALQSGVAFEINANPRRLDLDAPYARRAIGLGIPIAINSDAHSAEGMDVLSYGVVTARRAWAEARHILNCWSYEEFNAWLRARNG